MIIVTNYICLIRSVDDGASNIHIGKELGFETFQPKNGEDWREEMTAILEK